MKGTRQCLANALSERESNLLVQRTIDEGLLGVDLREFDVRNPSKGLVYIASRNVHVSSPFSPLPAELEVAQVVCKPIHESVEELHIHRLQTAEEESNGTTQTGSNGCG